MFKQRGWIIYKSVRSFKWKLVKALSFGVFHYALRGDLNYICRGLSTCRLWVDEARLWRSRCQLLSCTCSFFIRNMVLGCWSKGDLKTLLEVYWRSNFFWKTFFKMKSSFYTRQGSANWYKSLYSVGFPCSVIGMWGESMLTTHGP